MNTNRLNSFTDGVVAIIITIMVLELPVPKGAGLVALAPLGILFAAYALSFVKVGIYWSQHHNMLQVAKKVSGPVLLANLFFLFWLSLIPFVVRWVGEAGITRDTVLAFGVIMLLCAVSFATLRQTLISAEGGAVGRCESDRPRPQGAGDDRRLFGGNRSRLGFALLGDCHLCRRRGDVARPRQKVRSADRLIAPRGARV